MAYTTRMRVMPIGVLAAVGLGLCMPAAERSAYEAEIESWRQQRENRLKADGGWLTVAGLFWLKQGENRFGSDRASDILLPADSAPPAAGSFQFKGGVTTVKAAPGVTITHEGKPVTVKELTSDAEGSPDLIALGALTMQVIKRGERYAIRLKDMNSAMRREFKGLRWYPVSDSFRRTARFVPHQAPQEIAVPNVLGTVEKMPSPGVAVFTLNGQEMRLEPVLETPDATELFFIFRDQTAGQTTYPAGRFLYAGLPKDGELVLDFNKAYNPPCAFTPYATCPLPPPQNVLPARVEAGELSYGDH